MKKSIKISLLVIILLVGGIFVYKNKISSPKQAYAEMNFPDGINEVLDPNFNLKITYPKDWNYITNTDKGGYIEITNFDWNGKKQVTKNNNDELFKMEIHQAVDTYNLTLREWLDGQNSINKEENSALYNKIISSEKLDLNGNEAILEKNDYGYSLYVLKDNKIYIIYSYFKDQKNEELFFSVINSFK